MTRACPSLFEPLGIEDVEWYKYAQGNVRAAAGLRLRPRDLAKIGQLVLQRGMWSGKQVVSASWIRSSTTPQLDALDLYFYGYQFWLGRSLVDKREVLWSSAIGNGGQEWLSDHRPFSMHALMTRGQERSSCGQWH
jgi:CubicO group peptidase (beta-lactamase class C family)